MEAVAWSAIGLLGTAFGVLATAYFRLSGRMEEVRRDLGGRMEAQTSRTDALNARMDSHMGGRHLG